MSVGLWGDPNVLWGDPNYAWDGTPVVSPPPGPVIPDDTTWAPVTFTTWAVDYRYELLDRLENTLGDLVGVVRGSGSHKESAQAQVHTGAQVTVRDTGQVTDWVNSRIRVWVTVNGQEWPVGTYVPSIPRWEHSQMGRVAQVTLADKTVMLRRDAFGLVATGVPAGANIVDAVQAIIHSTGETNVALTPAPDVLEAGVEWEPDKNKLTAVNTLLDAANRLSLWCDGLGQYQVTPYQAPATRGTRLTLVDGVDGVTLPDHGIYSPVFTTEQDLDRIANVYQAISATEGDDEALFAEAENDDPDDPLSTVNRGRVMPESGPEFDVPTSGQAALQAYAERKLLEQATPALTLTVRTPPRKIRFNDVVQFHSDHHGIHGRFVVSNIDAPHQVGEPGLWTLTLRSVTT